MVNELLAGVAGGLVSGLVGGWLGGRAAVNSVMKTTGTHSPIVSGNKDEIRIDSSTNRNRRGPKS